MKEVPRGKRRIPAGVPAGAVVLHRPGTMAGTANSTGIVELPGGRHLVIAVFTKASSSALGGDRTFAALIHIAAAIGSYDRLP
jgi:beta-lactamase class A